MTITRAQLQEYIDHHLDALGTLSDAFTRFEGRIIAQRKATKGLLYLQGDQTSHLSPDDAVTIGGPPGSRVFQVPQAGSYNIDDDSGDVALREISETITEVDDRLDDDFNHFGVSGNFQFFTWPGGIITISGSTGNDGTYTVTRVAYDSDDNETHIHVAEQIEDTTVDGTLTSTTTRVELAEELEFNVGFDANSWLFHTDISATNFNTLDDGIQKAYRAIVLQNRMEN